MKKLIFLLVAFVSLMFTSPVYPQRDPAYSIPAYDVPVEGIVNFVEDRRSPNSDPAKERRKIKVHVQTGSGKENSVVGAYVYSLDRTTVLGPYMIKSGETLQVDIDERDWGVVVQSEQGLVYMDVWIDTRESEGLP